MTEGSEYSPHESEVVMSATKKIREPNGSRKCLKVEPYFFRWREVFEGRVTVASVFLRKVRCYLVGNNFLKEAISKPDPNKQESGVLCFFI